MFRLYVERKSGFENEANRIFSEITGFLGISSVKSVRYLNRYDVENVSEGVAKAAATRIFSEPQSDTVCFETLEIPDGATQIVWEYLPGQYDQRADSAEQCLSLLREGLRNSVAVGTEAPRVRCAKIVILEGSVSAGEVEKIQHYLINPVDSRLASGSRPETLKIKTEEPKDIETVTGFISLDEEGRESLRARLGLAMDGADVKWMQDYFISKHRDPTITEIRVLDTYWSDHCRHTTFNTILRDIKIPDGPYAELFRSSLKNYTDMRAELYADRNDKPVTLMDMAVIGAKYLRRHGKLDDLEVSEENNACSVYIDVKYTTSADGKRLPAGKEETERWLLEFKNETHNHPTEIEPFGGAATCIGGAIRDPLSARSWVYQALRVTGAADPTVPLSETLPGKLPQMKLTREAAQGFSSYGNQIGLTTGQVHEVYHPGYLAKRMELGAVIAAAPVDLVLRETPEPGDVIILLGGGTGRDGIGGATGSSKVHTEKSVTTAAAEVQKGNAVEERKIQRLFRNKEVCLMIRRCNDFGAGGVSVAVGELAPGLDINLDAVPKKYEGLDGTELAISESQERMAVVVKKENAGRFIEAASAENLNAVEVASVTDTNRMVMRWRGKVIVDIDRSFIDTAGAPHRAEAVLPSPEIPGPDYYSGLHCCGTDSGFKADIKELSPQGRPLDSVIKALGGEKEYLGRKYGKTGEALSSGMIKKLWLTNIADLACCSQRGLGERFDGSIGAASVLMPYGGKYQCTPEAGMAAKIPVLSPRETSTVSLMTFGYDPRISEWSPWHGAQNAVLSSLVKILCLGGNPSSARLSFQEFFGRTVDDAAWGKPAAALLGALDAQKSSGCASIGGKDSMSGTFKNLNVPNTLVSFAVTTEDVKNVTSGAFKKSGSSVYAVRLPGSVYAPDFNLFNQQAEILYRMNAQGKIRAMYPVGAGGIPEAVSKMSMGNRIGFSFDSVTDAVDFAQGENLLLVETDCDVEAEFSALGARLSAEKQGAKLAERIGVTIAEPCIVLKGTRIPLPEIEDAWEKRLSAVFPPVSGARVQKRLEDWALGEHPSLERARAEFTVSSGTARPRVIIPVFPGTNCEYDMARAFNLSGADTRILVFRNRTQEQLAQSLEAFRKEIDASQIVAFAGGFSSGDEPDGSGKFIANVIKAPVIADGIMNLLKNRDGLVLGICNGFQALIKTGLVPYGEIREMTSVTPTLTFNTIGRHISRVVRTRITSATSPWAMDESVLEKKLHLVPVSHGEGRIVIGEELARELFDNGQVFTQYVDENGIPSITEPDNPNGSLFAIEGLTSPDGRVLGKMGHSERTVGTDSMGASVDLIKNIAFLDVNRETESSCQNIFRAGVRYFK